ncbi:MAG: dipicolinate synthase subunit B [Eubacteriales bacterium]|jgi:dipicolinate synthase subunit B
MVKTRLGVAMCGSFCTFSRVMQEIEHLVQLGYEVTPIMSETSYSTDTRFGKAADFVARLEEMTDRPVIHTIAQAEPIGPKKLLDILLIMPCTGNTLGKLACGITDTAVTMACKSHRRNNRPVVIGVSSNDSLGASGANIGALLNQKNLYFLPMGQDDPVNKENSLVADFSRAAECVEAALQGRQVQPMLF